jgi:hypothetical protein
MMLPFGLPPIFGAQGRIRYISSSSYVSSANSSTHTIDRPSGVLSGDLMLLFGLNTSSSSAPVTVPAGWTKILDEYTATGSTHVLFAYKSAGSSESSTYDMTLAGSRAWSAGIINLRNASYSRQDNNAVGSSTATAGASGSLTAVPPTASLIYFSGSGSSVTSTAPSGYTELMELGPASGFSPAGVFQISARIPSPSGDTGTVRNTWSGSITGSRAVLVEVI